MEKLSKRCLRNSARGLGISVALLFILSQESPRAGELDNISKAVAWTGMVFLPLFGLNLDLYRVRAARIAGLAMLGVHAFLVTLLYKELPTFDFIAVAPMAVLEMFVLVVPFLRIRKGLDS